MNSNEDFFVDATETSQTNIQTPAKQSQVKLNSAGEGRMQALVPKSILDGANQCLLFHSVTTDKDSKCARAYRCDEFGCSKCLAFGEEEFFERANEKRCECGRGDKLPGSDVCADCYWEGIVQEQFNRSQWMP